jgi:cytidylate kinase
MTIIITLDGPTASGKGAVAAALAEHLGFDYLDSGALYRLVAWQALHAGWTIDTPFDDEHKLQLSEWARHLNVVFTHQHIILNDADVTSAIRAEAVGNMASKIAAVSSVRTALLQRQRDFARGKGLVADGRDMGSVVFPDAPVKVFLTASSEIRAERRYKQLINKGFSANMRDLVADLNERDERDTKRIHAPLKPAQGAYVLDSTDLTLPQTVAKILDYYASIVA